MAICTCGYVPPDGCTCGWQDGESIAWTGIEGQPDQRQADVIRNDDDDNLLDCRALGLYAALPSRFRDPPSARVYRSSVQAIETGILTQCIFDAAVFNAHGIWDSSGAFNITTAGMYVITHSVRWEASSAGSRHLQVHLDGGPIAQDGFEAIVADDVANSVIVPWPLPLGSVITFHVYQDSGGQLDTIAANATNNNMRNSAAICFLGDM